MRLSESDMGSALNTSTSHPFHMGFLSQFVFVKCHQTYLICSVILSFVCCILVISFTTRTRITKFILEKNKTQNICNKANWKKKNHNASLATSWLEFVSNPLSFSHGSRALTDIGYKWACTDLKGTQQQNSKSKKS